jgi:hypothetical protein
MLICVSCVRFPAELAPHGADKSIIAIRVKSGGFFGWLGGQPAIFFVRLQADGQNRQGDLLISNHRADGYAYLINASPGRYAAIGAGVHSTGQHTFGGSTVYSGGTSYWYFPASMIDETIVTVEPSEVAFMGEFEISGDLGFDDADDTQKHYARFLDEDADQVRFNRWWHFHKSSLEFIAEYQKAPSEIATDGFMKSSRGLGELGWRAPNEDE